MNMKKTMAAIAAGAVAVSAMATTVSAINDGTYTYNLTTESWANLAENPAKATVVFKINSGATEEVEPTDASWVVNTAFSVTEVTTPADAVTTLDNGSGEATVAEDCAKSGTLTFDGAAWVPGQGDTITAADVDVSAITGAVQDDTIVVTAAVTSTTNYAVDDELTEDEYNALSAENQDKVTATEADPGEASTPIYPEEVEVAFPDATLKTAVVKIIDKNNAEMNNTYTYDAATHACVDGNTIKFENNEFANFSSDVIIEVTAEFECKVWGSTDTEDEVKAALKAGTIVADAGDDCEVSAVSLSSFKAQDVPGENKIRPFKTGLKNNTNIIDFLENTKNYKNVKAVLNDAISNYDTVTFTFNTATAPIGYCVDEGDTNIYWDSDGDGIDDNDHDISWNKIYVNNYDSSDNTAAGSYETALALAGGDVNRLYAVYTDAKGATTEYMGFAQHLYPSYYTPEATDWTGFAWEGYNLFQGALIINEYQTMSLSQTDYFDWTQTTLSFDWDAIMDGYDVNRNEYAVWLHSMKLATSNTWYWDSLTVECTNGAEEDASSDAGVDGDGAELDDEVADDEIAADDTAEDEAPADDTADEEPAPAPAPEVSNPTTGNASVALAVIPVALAAAAVVAKKRS